MRSIGSGLALLALCLTIAPLAYAQDPLDEADITADGGLAPAAGREEQPEDTTTRDRDAELGACLGCGGCGALLAIPFILLILNIALLVWVARDAKARGMDSAVLWMVLVMFTSVIGLLIYLFSRPQGNLIRCPYCNNARMVASARCPHCGNA
jgi:hypothetical protein